MASSLTLLCSSSLRYVNKYLAVDSGGYLSTNFHRALTTAWRNTSQRSRDSVRLDRFTSV